MCEILWHIKLAVVTVRKQASTAGTVQNLLDSGDILREPGFFFCWFMLMFTLELFSGLILLAPNFSRIILA